jgi:general secretion pathway protein M
VSETKTASAGGPVGLKPVLALVAYVALLIMGAASIWTSWEELEVKRALVNSATERAARMAAQGVAGPRGDALPDDIPRNAAYLTGDRLSVASAELQKRATNAVTSAGGSVVSAQIERQEPKDFVTGVEVTVDCDINQPGLQRLLHELESSSPFLFVESLTIKARNDARENEFDPRLRVSVRLSANWRNAEP